MPWLIRTFTSGTGQKPVEEWIDSLTPDGKAAVLDEFKLLRIHGIALAMPHARPVGDGIWELRAKGRDGIYRILYFHWKGHTMGVLHGFTKQTRVAPARELAIARQRRNTWLAR